jgi:hypothetical protein
MKLRILTAIAVLVSAYVHLKLWLDGFRDLHVVGPAFLLNAVAGVLIAAALVWWRHWLPPLLAAGFGLSTLGAFIISATVGLYGVHERWVGGYVWAAAISEAVALAGGLAILLREYRLEATSSGVESQHRFALRRADLH